MGTNYFKSVHTTTSIILPEYQILDVWSHRQIDRKPSSNNETDVHITNPVCCLNEVLNIGNLAIHKRQIISLHNTILQCFYSMHIRTNDPWYLYTRGIWKVRSMVQFFSNRLTNPFMFGIILNSCLCSMLGNKLEVHGMWQAQYILLWIHILFGHWKTQIFNEINNI